MFIQQLREEVRQQLEVSEIEREQKPDDSVDRVDEYFRNAPAVFTEDSYDQLTTDILAEWLKTLRGKNRLKELEAE